MQCQIHHSLVTGIDSPIVQYPLMDKKWHSWWHHVSSIDGILCQQLCIHPGCHTLHVTNDTRIIDSMICNHCYSFVQLKMYAILVWISFVLLFNKPFCQYVSKNFPRWSHSTCFCLGPHPWYCMFCLHATGTGLSNRPQKPILSDSHLHCMIWTGHFFSKIKPWNM